VDAATYLMLTVHGVLTSEEAVQQFVNAQGDPVLWLSNPTFDLLPSIMEDLGMGPGIDQAELQTELEGIIMTAMEIAAGMWPNVQKQTPKTCPLCGGEGTVSPVFNYENLSYSLECVKCGARIAEEVE